MTKPLTIAIDGYSGCGKSTIAKDLAKALNYVFIDSGAMYRGVALYALNNGWVGENDLNERQLIDSLNEIHITFELPEGSIGKHHLFLNGQDVESEIRTLRVSNAVSPVAAISEVRKKLVDLQRKMGEKGGVVMDGRDIGSVVFPHAELKFFVTAHPDIRAQRRQAELAQKGENYTIEEIRSNLEERDHLDTSRADSPLIQLPEAILIDTSEMTRESQLAFALEQVKLV